MWTKSLSAKIFLAFAFIAAAQVAALSILFGKKMKSNAEAYVMDALSNRLQVEASKLAEAESLEEKAKELQANLLQKDGLFLRASSIEESQFFPEELSQHFPAKGTWVTPCLSRQGKNFLCAYSVLPGGKLAVFDALPLTTVTQIFLENLKEILILVGALLLLALLLTFYSSRLLLNPLKNFAVAARAVAKGDYGNIQLPRGRSDEIGDLSSAFERMISDLRDRERSLAASAVKLAHSARLASIGQMGAGIAHEVKNPLTSMIGYARHLSNKTQDPELKESAEIILKESERCNTILQQMLRFARNDPQEHKPYAVSDMIHSTLLLAKAQADARRITLVTEGPKTSPIAIGSAQQTQQVVLNLVLNAIQASPANSKVFVRIVEESSFVVIEVEDSGCGIPEHVQERIFDPFFTTKPKSEGTGLGLSVAMEIVQNQNGHLAFESEVNKGSRFTVRLPLA